MGKYMSLKKQEQKAVRQSYIREGAFVDLLNQEMKELQSSMKQKQIEEMAKDIEKTFTYAKKYYDDDFEPYELEVYPDEIARELYNAGCRKISENAVVLTEKELKEKIDCCDVSMIHHDEDGKLYIEYEKYEDFTDRLGKRIQQLKGQLKQARKETAEKIMNDISSDIIVINTKEYGNIEVISVERLQEICNDIIDGE